MQPPRTFVGVDVSKATLDVCVLDGATASLANETGAIQAWVRSLPPDAAIAMESTGRYHQVLVRACHAAGRKVFVLNAKDVYFYAKALSQRGKTDRLDARVIARYLAEHHRELKAWEPPPEWTDALQDLLRCRAGIADKRASIKLMLKEAPALADEAATLDKSLGEVLACIDTKIQATIEAQKPLAERAARLMTIPGIGPQASAMLLALFSRIKFCNSDAVVAFSGLDPRPRDSGSMKGRRRLSKRGDPALRRQMYLVALAATRSRLLREHYKSIKARGFEPTQALVILARKLLRVAFNVWKKNKDFDVDLIGVQRPSKQP